MKKEIREFNTGANRDTNEQKFEYARFFSPIVLKRYAEYMHKNRFLSNGDTREPDNWKKLFGDNHEQVCLDSLARHFFDLWLNHEGYTTKEDKEDAICGIMFNAMAYLHKKLDVKAKN